MSSFDNRPNLAIRLTSDRFAVDIPPRSAPPFAAFVVVSSLDDGRHHGLRLERRNKPSNTLVLLFLISSWLILFIFG